MTTPPTSPADTRPAEVSAPTVGDLMAAAFGWASDGEGEIPAIIRDLPAADQAVLLGGAHDLVETVRHRVAEAFGDPATTTT